MSNVLVLSHANIENRKVYFTLPIVAWHYNKPTECTIIYTSFNNGIAVKETPEQIKQLVEQAQGATNVPTGTKTVRQTDDVREHKARKNGRRNR